MYYKLLMILLLTIVDTVVSTVIAMKHIKHDVVDWVLSIIAAITLIGGIFWFA